VIIIFSDAIVAETREWIGTPWQHQASLKGIACDCVGLVRGVYTEVTGRPVECSTDYYRIPISGRETRLVEELSKYANEVPLESRQPGDVLLFSFLSQASNHVGIDSGNGQFIHAWLDVNRTVEMPLSDEWLRSLRHVFRIPEES